MDKRAVGGTLIELNGNRSAAIDGCDGIGDYSDTEVIVKAGRMCIHFIGRDFRLKRLTENTALIEGFISTIQYTF